MSLPVTNEAEFRQYQHLLQGQGRPPVAPETQLCVFLTDLECAMASAPAVVKARQVGLDSVPRVTLFGVTDAGMCVALHVWGFQPYFYVAVDEANVSVGASAYTGGSRGFGPLFGRFAEG
ncbi:MAG: uncharacterized protein KVP18_001990 [Porospora cf. gigantea A]|uniref:uncharacterized protein n=1 Tax=Porospora cf. gigantea A TaxID=2853593 RepID=UPI00355A057F|nr:MAG: hypothetical protein KVP18_001990 [Porospora cf. gigantea A]